MNDLGGQSIEPATPPSSDEKTMALIAHLLGIFTCIIGPLVIFLIKKDQSEFVRLSALQALYWQIGVFVAAIVLGVVTICIGGIGVSICSIAALVYGIVAVIRTNEGKLYSYPLTGKFVK